MKNHNWILTLTLLFAATLTVSGQDHMTNSRAWSGVIVNSGCSADDAYAEAPKCTESVSGAKLALYDDTTRQVFELEPQAQAAGHLADSVTVHGVLEGNTIRVSSLELLTAIGLAVGKKAPDFSAPDQFGHQQTLESLKGPHGTVLLFYRSADWWPYCKGQLVQLQNAKARFEKEGINLVAISYDSVAILKSFADRRKIDFPMLADPDSRILDAYHVVNDEATGQFKGMARPGYFLLDTQGVIREKFFEAKYRERVSANSLMTKLFPELGEEVTDNVEAPHLHLAVAQSDRIAFSGNHITLTAEVQLPPDVHVYAPGVKGYKAIRLEIDPRSEFQLKPAVYPQSKILYLSAIKERVPVFEGKFFIRQDVQVATGADFGKSLGADGKTITITGKLDYQACDSKICFLPASVPVQWQLQLLPLDRQRAPDDIQHK